MSKISKLIDAVAEIDEKIKELQARKEQAIAWLEAQGGEVTDGERTMIVKRRQYVSVGKRLIDAYLEEGNELPEGIKVYATYKTTEEYVDSINSLVEGAAIVKETKSIEII